MKVKTEEKLRNTSVVIVSHIFATGPALELETYLKDKVARLLFIGHPFTYTKDTRSFCRSYEKGKILDNRKSIKLPNSLTYIKEIVLTLYWVLRTEGKVNLYIGSDNFSAYLGIILQKMGKVEDVVLYTIDYMQKRFDNPILNYIYHYFDRACLKSCNIVWNVSERMMKGRKEDGIDPRKSSPQIVVPLGVWIDRIKYRLLNKREDYSIIFLGHLLKKQGLQKVIGAMPLIIKKHKKATLTIIGTGPYEEKLKQLSEKKYNLGESVRFLGYIKDHRRVEKYLTDSCIAVAPYVPEKSSFTYFADPGKIKNYLAAGLAVIVTDVPSISKDIEIEHCGYIVKYNSQDIANKINRLFSNKNLLSNTSRRARAFATKFDWNKIFSEAIKKTLE